MKDWSESTLIVKSNGTMVWVSVVLLDFAPLPLGTCQSLLRVQPETNLQCCYCCSRRREAVAPLETRGCNFQRNPRVPACTTWNARRCKMLISPLNRIKNTILPYVHYHNRKFVATCTRHVCTSQVVAHKCMDVQIDNETKFDSRLYWNIIIASHVVLYLFIFYYFYILLSRHCELLLSDTYGFKFVHIYCTIYKSYSYSVTNSKWD